MKWYVTDYHNNPLAEFKSEDAAHEAKGDPNQFTWDRGNGMLEVQSEADLWPEDWAARQQWPECYR